MRLNQLAKPFTWASVALALTSAAAYAQSSVSAPVRGIALLDPETTGALLGEIRNAAGIEQMGATVLLYDRFDRLVRRTISNESGRFGFAGLTPDAYTIRVSLASFLPALRRNITVLAGSENFLQVSLTTLLSSIDVAPGAPNRATLMSDEWKWVLRSAQSTRPALRFLPPEPQPRQTDSATFLSDVTGVVRVSAGESNVLANSMQQDMGTAFALETSVNRVTKVRVSGSLGYAAESGLPSASFRTTYARERQGLPGPQIALTVRQAYFPAGFSSGNTPMLRTASLSNIDSIDLLDALHFEYGFSLDSITLYGRMNYFSPFARATYSLSPAGEIKVAYSSGFTPTEMLARDASREAGTDQDLIALAQAPRISRRDHHAAVERTKNYEASYTFNGGSWSASASAFREDLTNAVFLVSGDTGIVGVENLLPDINSRGTVFNGGDYQRTGVQLAFTHAVNDLLEVAVAAGRAEALIAGDPESAPGLRSQIHQSPRVWAAARIDSALPWSGTRLSTSYGWTDFRALMPVHQALTGRTYQQLGWNVSTNQPLPAMLGVRMELVAEARNLLAQGYLTLRHKDGGTASLTNTPRQVRAGLSFLF